MALPDSRTRGLPPVSSMRSSRRIALVSMALLGTALVPLAAPAQNAPQVEVSSAVHHDTLPSLRNAPPQPARTHSRVEHDLPLPNFPPDQSDGALQSQARRSLSTPGIISSVDGVGQGFSGPQGNFNILYAPPDTIGAVGATQYVQVVNTAIAVFDKATKTAIYGPVATSTLWSGFGGGCENNDDGDAVVVYDKAANRWVISQFSVSTTPYLECVAVSQTSDATGAYDRYSFSYGNTNFPDYPKMGVWPDGYYMSFNVFANGNSFSGSNLCVYDRTAMLAGTSATQQCFQLSSSYGGVLPSDLDGSTPPPAGSPNYFLNFDTNSLNLWKFHVDWSNSADTTLTGPVNIPVAAFVPACNGGACIPQSGTSEDLDSLADRLMYRLAYRNFGAHESLVVNQSVAVGMTHRDQHTGVRWYEIRNPGGTPVVYQQSTYSPDSSYRWMGSIAMDKLGDIALGYSVSDSSIYPAIRFAARLAGDPLSTLQSEVSMIEGGGSQGHNLNRWGDYSGMTIDPVDDCTFWYTNEYLKTSGTFNWSTRIGSFKFPGCTAGPSYTVTASAGAHGSISPSTQTVASSSTASFTVTPDAGYHVSGVSGDHCSVTQTNGTLWTSSVITQNCAVTASFAINTYTLSYSAGPNGSITGNTSQSVDYGGSGTQVTAVADTGYHFVQWSDASTSNPRTDTNVMADVDVTAQFAANVLVFTTQPVNPLSQGAQLGTIAVSEQDGIGNTITDNATVDFSVTTGCGTLDLGSAVMVNGVATLTSTQRFYTLATALVITATVSDPNPTPISAQDSSSFDVTTNAGLIFSDGFEGCRP